MANLTTNYGLTKPLQDETYDVDVFNANMDKLDVLIKSLEKKFMPQVGDVIITLDGTNPGDSRYPNTTWALVEGGEYIRAAGTGIAAGSEGGSDTVTLAKENLPSHDHTGTIASGGAHAHTGTTDNYDLSGNFRSRSNVYYGKGAESTIGSVSANGKFSVLQDGLRSEGNADNNRNEYICHFNGLHNHQVTINRGGDHTHTITINATGEGKPFTVTPRYRAFYIWVRQS